MKITPATFAFALATSAAYAGSVQVDGKTSPIQTTMAEPNKVEFNFGTTTDYVFSSDFKDSDALGDQDAFHGHVDLGVTIPISGPVYFALNAFYDRFDFGTSLAPVPTTLHQVGADVGFEYRVEGKAAFSIKASPGVYSSEITSDGFNIPVLAYGSYRVTPSLIVVAGARYNQWSEYEVLPLAGFIWKVNDHLVVNGILPDPAVEYTVNEDVTVRFGGQLVGGTYRTAKNETNFPHENLDYYDLRAGAGISYTGFKPVNLQVSAGWSFKREFRYDDADLDYELEGAPYVSVAAKAAF